MNEFNEEFEDEFDEDESYDELVEALGNYAAELQYIADEKFREAYSPFISQLIEDMNAIQKLNAEDFEWVPYNVEKFNAGARALLRHAAKNGGKLMELTLDPREGSGLLMVGYPKGFELDADGITEMKDFFRVVYAMDITPRIDGSLILSAVVPGLSRPKPQPSF